MRFEPNMRAGGWVGGHGLSDLVEDMADLVFRLLERRGRVTQPLFLPR